MPASASAAFACTADAFRQSMVLTWFAFLQTPEHLKTETAEESFNPDGLAQRSIKLLKDKFPDIEVSLLVQRLNTHTVSAQAAMPSPTCCEIRSHSCLGSLHLPMPRKTIAHPVSRKPCLYMLAWSVYRLTCVDVRLT